MTRCCILFTTDQKYLFPTLVSAIQARKQSSPKDADVIIFHFGVEAGAAALFADICASETIGFIAVSPDLVEQANPMMARLFLNRFVPAQYDQYLYLDGDIHINGSLEPVITAVVPPGRFLAVNDPMTFMLGEPGALPRELAAHMGEIGLSAQQAASYFNTGVLRINREGWDETGLEAWKATLRGAKRFRFPDQDPLNIVGADRHIPLSLVWNFPIFLENARVAARIRPRLLHFMSMPKPWHGAFQPWGQAATLPYLEVLRRYPELLAHRSAMPPAKRLRYHLQQRYKQVTEGLTWGFGHRRAKVLQYEATAALSASAAGA